MEDLAKLCTALHYFLALLTVGTALNRSDSITYQKVYYDVQTTVSCYRRFNGTHEIGCSTGLSGNVGVLHYINDTASLDWLLGQSSINFPYIPLITSYMFSGDNVRRLVSSTKISGMMVTLADTADQSAYPDGGFSPDQSCPNRYSSIYKDGDDLSCAKHQYNPKGSGLMFEDLKMPVVVLKSQSEIDRVLQCYTEHNTPYGTRDFPLCAAELKAFMHGAGSTEICMRRNGMIRNFSPDSYCQMLGGRSSHAFLYGTLNNETRDDNSTIVITARSDAFSLFEFLQPGASSPVAGLVTLLAIAEALNKFKDNFKDAGKNILFTLLTGESFDYIGSQKLIFDMEKGFFPNKSTSTARMYLKHINLIVELSQLMNGTDSLFLHKDNVTSAQFPQINEFYRSLKAAAGSLNVSQAKSALPLPPSSSHMFIRANKLGMPAVVLSDFDDSFKTDYYNSYLDTALKADIQYPKGLNSSQRYDFVTPKAQFLANIASMVATAVVNYALNQTVKVEASTRTTTHLLYCLLENPKCDLFYSVIEPDWESWLDNSTSTYPFYVGVYQAGAFDPVQSFMVQLLALYTGDAMNLTSQADCNNTFTTEMTESYYWMNGLATDGGKRRNICIKSTAQYHKATSPAFEIEDYDFKSNQYSTWAESVWPNNDPFHVRIFLLPSTAYQYICLFTGLAVTVLSIGVVCLLDKRAHLLFPPK